jgi:hypothetical protein
VILAFDALNCCSLAFLLKSEKTGFCTRKTSDYIQKMRHQNNIHKLDILLLRLYVSKYIESPELAVA